MQVSIISISLNEIEFVRGFPSALEGCIFHVKLQWYATHASLFRERVKGFFFKDSWGRVRHDVVDKYTTLDNRVYVPLRNPLPPAMLPPLRDEKKKTDINLTAFSTK